MESSTDGGDDAGTSPTDPPRQGPAPEIPTSDALILRNGEVVGLGRVDLRIDGTRISEIGNPTLDAPGIPTVDLDGFWVAPAFIDNHVHLHYWNVPDELAAGGITAAVDLAAPMIGLSSDYPALVEVKQSGPMITAPGGYPLDGWGVDGYGIETATPKQARDHVGSLADAGAELIKIPLTGPPELDDATFAAAVDEAHLRSMKVVVHALSDAEVRRAGTLGADVLAHAPIEPLDPSTVELWKDGAVIPTLDAFGPSQGAIEAVSQLRAAGATVLYGTDLGNARTAAISERELDWMAATGMDDGEILASGTSAPAAYWGFDGLGTIEVGATASLLILRADPRVHRATLAEPANVLIGGTLR